MGFAAREARLRPQFARLYPSLRAGQWELAAEIGSRILMWQLQQFGPVALGERLLPESHFEFRGGEPRPAEEAPRKSRVTDGDGLRRLV
ncbi:MAG: hypothetical protein ABJD11_15770 [Gemmatimonadota bacterium]